MSESVIGVTSRIRMTAVIAAATILAAPGWAALASDSATGHRASGPWATPGCVTGSWPMYQGDPTHAADACSSLNASNVDSLHPAWFVPTSGPVTGTPAVAFGSVFAGDYAGLVHAVSQATGAALWTFDTTAPQPCFDDAPIPHADTHKTGFGRIPASPAAATVDGEKLVYLAAGGSVYALDARSGRCVWAQDTDPGQPADAVEIESSPVIDTALPRAEVLVGNDDNSSSGVAVTGLMAFDAATGHLLWRYEPERDVTITPAEFGGSDALTLSCGDGSPDPTYCTPAHLADLAPNSVDYADGCGDVWSSPALDADYSDPGGPNSFQGSSSASPAGWYPKSITASGTPNRAGAPDGLVVFGTGNCSARPTPAAALAHGDYVDNQAIFALDPVTGVRVWNFVEPYDTYDANAGEPGGGDDDFGSSPMIATVPAASLPVSGCPAEGTTSKLVIEGSKSGKAYGLCAASGQLIWSNQAAQAGQVSAALVGAVGGFIGSPSLGLAGGRPTAFFTSAIPTPLANDGVRPPGDGDSNIPACPGLSGAPLLPACPDLTPLGDPARLASLHALDAATGTVRYQAPSLPTYAASTYTDGLVFVPDSLAASVIAFDADRGIPVWAFPLGGVPASAAAIAGNSIYLGTGEAETTLGGQTVPPQVTGIWAFTTSVPAVGSTRR